MPDSAIDLQQHFVSSMLLSYGEQLETAHDKMVELPKALFDAQSNMMKKIIEKSAGAVAGEGLIAVLGGIQINTPVGFTDYYLPLSFELFNNSGAQVDDLMKKKKDEAPFPKVKSLFPGAYTNEELNNAVSSTLLACGYDRKKTLVATSLCCDEVNRPLENVFSKHYDAVFNMGGLAGFPFGGKTSFGAMAAHIPDGGSCLVVHGPHVGVDSSGLVGTVERRGRANGGACCGSAVAAANYVEKVRIKQIEKQASPTDVIDAQQYFVGSMLLPYADCLAKATNKMVELPRVLFDSQRILMKRIVKSSSGAVAGEGKVAVLGGIQINTPSAFTDYFLPLSFELYDCKGDMVDDLMDTFIKMPKYVRSAF